jgi:hypothetical protein
VTPRMIYLLDYKRAQIGLTIPELLAICDYLTGKTNLYALSVPEWDRVMAELVTNSKDTLQHRIMQERRTGIFRGYREYQDGRGKRHIRRTERL